MLYEILTTFDHNPHYLNRYIKFILTCSEKNVNQKNLEKHHICPRSKYLFPQYQSFAEHPWNRVGLTYRQHYIAHWILSKVYTHSLQRSSVLKAFYRMSSISKDHYERNITSKMFARCRMANSIAMKINNPTKSLETRNKMKESKELLFNSPRGDLLRAHMSKIRTGRCDITENGLKRLSEIWIGVPKPKTKDHINNHRKSLTTGVFKTPFGEFDSPQQASDSEMNIQKLSRYLINKSCKESKNGFDFIPKNNNQIL